MAHDRVMLGPWVGGHEKPFPLPPPLVALRNGRAEPDLVAYAKEMLPVDRVDLSA